MKRLSGWPPALRPTILGVAIALACTSCSSEPSVIDPSIEVVTTAAKPQHIQVPLDEASDMITIGILSIDSAVSVHRRYRLLLDYLSEETGYSFRLVPLTQASQFKAVATEAVDFVLTNPLASVEIQQLYGTQFVATQSRLRTGDSFGGLIIVKQDSPIQKLDDLRGKRVACVDFQTAAAGCVFQIYHLLQRGIEPNAAFDAFIEISSQDNIILAVLNGTVDAGFIRTGQIERTVAKGLISDAELIRVLEPITHDFFYPHTTALYPEWPLSVLKHTPPSIASAVEDKLLSMSANHPALTAAGLVGFVPVRDYASLESLIEQLDLTFEDAAP